MSGRHQPLNGADSPEARSPYVVLMEDRWAGTGERINVRIAAAYGPRDARNQAQLDHPGYTFLKAEEVGYFSPDDARDGGHSER